MAHTLAMSKDKLVAFTQMNLRGKWSHWAERLWAFWRLSVPVSCHLFDLFFIYAGCGFVCEEEGEKHY